MRSLVLLFAICLDYISTVNIPPNNCSKYFQYREKDGEFFGEITLLDLKKQAIHIELQIEQLEPLTEVGDLVLNEDDLTTEKYLLSGQPISYRVTFPSQFELPKVVAINVNGIEICSGTSHNDHYSVTYSHSFFPSNMPETEDFFQTPISEPVSSPTPFTTTTTQVPYPEKPVQTRQLFSGPIPRFTTTPFTTTTTQVPYPEKPIQTPIILLGSGPIPRVATTPFTTIATQVQFSEPRIGTPNFAKECGNPGNILPFIVRGTPVLPGEFPWLVPIFRKVDDIGTTSFLCGGSLISTRTVLTAAHCFTIYNLRAERVMTFVGRNDIVNFGDDGMAPREIEKLVIHPQYSSARIPDADIALMHLMKPVSYSRYIKPICLWNEPVDYSRILGEIGVVAGWGKDERGNDFTRFPKKVTTEIVSEADCLRTGDIFRVLTSDRTICAGFRNQSGPCVGDSGGGLMIQRNGIWILRGIVSAGVQKLDTCDLDHYVVYCDLAKHSEWVNKNMLN